MCRVIRKGIAKQLAGHHGEYGKGPEICSGERGGGGRGESAAHLAICLFTQSTKKSQIVLQYFGKASKHMIN